MRSLCGTFLLLGLLACSSADEDADDSTRPDAGPPADAGPSCTAEPSVSATPATGSRAIHQGLDAGAEVVWTWSVTGSGPGPDIYTMTVNTGVELDTPLDLVDACTEGAPHCWLVDTDVTGAPAVPAQRLYADEGTLTVHELGTSGGRFRATIAGAKFFHYIAGTNGFTPAGDYAVCTTTIDTLSVDLPIE
jgi:hypothetical protein